MMHVHKDTLTILIRADVLMKLQIEPWCSVCHARFPDVGEDMWLPVPLTVWETLFKMILREVRNKDASAGDN
jgi:hypothetical protein